MIFPRKTAYSRFFDPVFNLLIRHLRYKSIFIVGCSHSGTSILASILNEHSRIYAIPYESQIFYQSSMRIVATSIKWQRECKALGKARWLEKTPMQIYQISRILELFPDSKVIILMRDGRDVACSLEKRNGNFLKCIHVWLEANESGEKYWDHPSVKLIKLEELVKDPYSIIKSIFNFLDERYEEKVFDYHKIPKYLYSSKIEKPVDEKDGESHMNLRNWQINQPLFKTTERWKQEMDKEQKRIFKDLAQDKLKDYGYVDSENW